MSIASALMGFTCNDNNEHEGNDDGNNNDDGNDDNDGNDDDDGNDDNDDEVEKRTADEIQTTVISESS